MAPPVRIAPSLLSCDFAQLGQEANELVEAGADYLHMDVMDGHFVPNITIGAPIIKALRRHTKAFLDCHLMVSDPGKWVDDFAEAGANLFMFHIEAVSDPTHIIQAVKAKGMKVGLAVKPATSHEAVLRYLPLIDMVLIMTVEPGFGGQAFMADCLHKVTAIRKLYPELDIEVDGGISLDTTGQAAAAGANVFVSGSAIFKSSDRSKAIDSMRTTATESYSAS